MKLAICGSRDLIITAEEVSSLVCYFTPTYLRGERVSEIVSGESGSVDLAAKAYAQSHPGRYSYRGFPADWPTRGKAAGPIRNQQIADYADLFLIIRKREGKSNGTDDMIKRALAARKPMSIVYWDSVAG